MHTGKNIIFLDTNKWNNKYVQMEINKFGAQN